MVSWNQVWHQISSYFLYWRMGACVGLVFVSLTLGCASAYKRSLGEDYDQVYTRVFLTDVNLAWQAVLEAIKSSRLDVSNREGGFIQTKWTDNTAEKNFTDSFGEQKSYIKARYRFRIQVAKGFFNGKPSVKVSVQKEQQIQKDVLEGWRPVESDTIEENTLLYRIGRVIYMRMRIAKLDELKTKRQLEQTEF